MVARLCRFISTVAAIAFWCTAPVHAGTVFNQPLLNQTDRGAFSWFNGQELADQFTVREPVAIDGLSWYGTFWQTDLAPGVTQYLFVIQFFDTIPASQYGQSLGDPSTASSTPFYEASVLANVFPSEVPFTGSDGGLDAINRTTYEFTANLNGPALQPDTEYWISILSNGSTYWRWANSTSGPSDYSVYRFVYLNESDWTGFSNAPSNLPTGANRGNLAFTLDGQEVPEPSSATCIAAGLIAALVGRKMTSGTAGAAERQ
jgi:hypothetical protein